MFPPHSRGRTAAGALLAMTGVLAGCGGGSPTHPAATPTGSPSILHLAFTADMGTPDPDVFYATEGLMLTNSVYQGLLQYADNSTRIAGSLADLPAVSDGGLTYSFTLHPRATFHDGTPVDAAAVAASFARRTAVNQGPAYMLQHVKKVDTPNATTLVVHLDRPISAFLDYLASPFGPKVLSPTAIKQHTVGSDAAQKWLTGHDAGSGPYQIASFEPDQGYVLKRFAQYSGPAPAYAEVDIKIISEVATQELELENGQLDMITHGLSTQDLTALATKPGLKATRYPTELKTVLFVNSHAGAFASAEARRALAQSLDRQALTQSVFGAAGAVSTQIYPGGELSTSVTTSTVNYDPSVLKSMADRLPTKNVDIGYDSTDPRNQLMADYVQVALAATGLKATVRAIPIAQIFDLATHLNQAPTILIQTTNPDAAHPDTWARIYMSSAGGANYLQCKDPAVDAQLDAGLQATTPAAANTAYGQAGNLLAHDACFIDISDVQDTIITRANLTNLVHLPSMPWALNLADISHD